VIRTTRAWCLLLALGALSSPFSGGAQTPALGPLTWEEGSPLQRLALTPAFERPDPLPRGRVSTEVWFGYTNLFEQDSTATHVLFLDAERLLTGFTTRWGAADGLEVGARITLETTGPGILDGLVHGFHELLDFGQANRDRFPQDAYEQTLEDGTGNVLLVIPRRTLDVEDVQIFAKWRVAESPDGRRALSLRATLRAPIASNTIGDERADGALVALGRTGMGRWYAHGMAGVGLVRASPELDAVLRDWSGLLGLGLERSLGARLSAVAQFQFATPLLSGFDHRELDWPANNLVFGLAGRFGEDWNWDASFQEDVPADTPAVDFTLSLRVSRAWR
jgi:hypothetical protein